MIDPWIHVRVALHKDSGKIVLPIFIELALKLQNLAIFEVGVDDIQIFVWPEHESPQFT